MRGGQDEGGGKTSRSGKEKTEGSISSKHASHLRIQLLKTTTLGILIISS